MYHFVMPFTKWEELDANPSIPAILSKAYGEIEGSKILKAGRSALAEVVVEVYQTRRGGSHIARPSAP